MFTIKEKELFIIYYLFHLVASEPKRELNESETLRVRLTIMRIGEAAGLESLSYSRLRLPKYRKGRPVLISEKLLQFLDAAMDEIKKRRVAHIGRSGLIEILLATLPCDDLRVVNDSTTYSRCLVSNEAFVARHECRVRVRLGWMKASVGSLDLVKPASSSKVVSLDRYKTPQIVGRKFPSPRLLTNKYEAYCFLRQLLDVRGSKKRYKRKTVEWAQYWADHIVRDHPLRRSQSSTSSRLSGNRESRFAAGNGRDEKVWCSERLMCYAHMIAYDYKYTWRTSLGGCCDLLALILGLYDDRYVRSDYDEKGNHLLIGTKKLERKYGVQMRVKLYKTGFRSA